MNFTEYLKFFEVYAKDVSISLFKIEITSGMSIAISGLVFCIHGLFPGPFIRSKLYLVLLSCVFHFIILQYRELWARILFMYRPIFSRSPALNPSDFHFYLPQINAFR